MHSTNKFDKKPAEKFSAGFLSFTSKIKEKNEKWKNFSCFLSSTNIEINCWRR